MKTNQAMIRPMGQFQVVQRTKDGMFNATTLLKQWNEQVDLHTQKNGYVKQKDLKEFFNNKGTQEFIEALKEDISQGADLHHGDMQIVKEVKARNTSKGKTKGQIWMRTKRVLNYYCNKFRKEVINENKSTNG